MSTPTLTLRQPSDVLVALPYVLGFHPQRSLVVAVLQGSRLVLTERVDLPTTARDLEHVVDELGSHAVRNGGTRAIVIGYDDEDHHAAGVVEAMTHGLRRHRIEVMDRYLVRGDRFWQLDCQDPTCCQPEGSPIPSDAAAAHLTAEFVGSGLLPQQSREALAALVEPGQLASQVARFLDVAAAVDVVDDEDVEAADVETERHHAWRRVLSPAHLVDAFAPVDAALAAVSLRDVTTRDGLVAWVTDGMLSRDRLTGPVEGLLQALDADWKTVGGPHIPESQLVLQDRLIALCAALPDPAAAPALCLLATHAWWRGNGALARIAIDRALLCDPDYRLARLMHLTLDLGVPATT